MKILKYIALAVVSLVLLFFAIGLVHPEVHYGHEVTVNKPLEEAWAVSQDVSKLDQWIRGFKSMELIEGDEGAVGSKYRIVVSPGEGQPDFVMVETIVSVKEQDHISLSFDSEMMVFEQTMSFADTDEGVTIKTESVVKGKTLPLRSMFALMEMTSGQFCKQEVKNLEALKTVIEQNTTDYFPTEVIMMMDSLTFE